MKNTDDTIEVLNQFNKEFDSSKKELINKFLQDQKELNRRFKEYALESDGECIDRDSNGNNAKVSSKQPFGRGGRSVADDDDCSLDSNRTEYSSSDSETQHTPSHYVNNAQRSRVNEQQIGASRVNRSQSLRISNQVKPEILMHTPRPPSCCGSRDINPVLADIKPLQGRQSRPLQKKLLVKRAERPKSALGYHTQASTLNEEAYQREHGFAPPDRFSNELRQNKVINLIQDSTRSAPMYRANQNMWGADLSEKRLSDQETLTLPTSLECSKIMNTSIRNIKPIDDGHTRQVLRESKPASSKRPNALRFIVHKPQYEGTGQLMGDAARPYKHDSTKSTLTDQSRLYRAHTVISNQTATSNYTSNAVKKDLSTPADPHTAHIRRYRAQNNLSISDVGLKSRFSKLKLPPVSKKKS